MKYYGLEHKEKIGNYMYFYARNRAKLLSLLPGKKESIGKITISSLSRMIMFGIEMIIHCLKANLLVCILLLLQI